MLERSIVVEDDHHAPGTIGLGATVTLRDTDDETEESYTLVGDYEADPDNQQISVASPLGKQLNGHRAGDSVAVTVNGFTTHYFIVTVS
jgi:transcription elongation factor GreA